MRGLTATVGRGVASVLMAGALTSSALLAAGAAGADPADPDPFPNPISPSDCMASAKVNCDLFGPYGLNDHDKPDNPPSQP